MHKGSPQVAYDVFLLWPTLLMGKVCDCIGEYAKRIACIDIITTNLKLNVYTWYPYMILIWNWMLIDSLEWCLFGFVHFRLDFALAYQKLSRLVAHSRSTSSFFPFIHLIFHLSKISPPPPQPQPSPTKKRDGYGGLMGMGWYVHACGHMIAWTQEGGVTTSI